MAKVTLIQVVYNSRKFIEPVFSAMASQTFKDIEIIAVISGNDDGGKELIAEKYPQVKIIDPGCNIGFARGHNLVFEQSGSEFFQLVNPDLIMEPDYVEKILKAFEDPKVGAATGKLYKISNFQFPISNEMVNSKILDTTGVTISKSGRARDRGQHETDNGQYDEQTDVQAVSAAGAMYRRAALEFVKLQKIGKSESRNTQNTNVPASDLSDSSEFEYFDEDFHSYWEDVDLAWRMTNAGWKCVYVPSAVAYHGRGAGSSPGGYKKIFSFVKFHRSLNPKVRQLNYKNHIFTYIKNSRRLYPQFFVRELFMFLYVLIFEISTLKVLPEMLRLLPKMWGKRKYIYGAIKH